MRTALADVGVAVTHPVEHAGGEVVDTKQDQNERNDAEQSDSDGKAIVQRHNASVRRRRPNV